MAAVDASFGNYTLCGRVASGGMAEVFLARPNGFDRAVAIKRILPHLSHTADFVRMFQIEGRLAARLSHPNIVHIYELGAVDDDWFIAMEFVDGIHAGQLIKYAGVEPIPPALVARIGAAAAAALHYAHHLTDSHGRPLHIVHRDVSPPNIMISFDGAVKLVDFGIAKALGGEQTRPGVVKGKYTYMSPEQTVGKKLDGKSDVFSLGLVLWELLAGRHAVERGDPGASMRALRDGRVPPIERVAPAVPALLAKAIGSALELRREERASAAELAESLESFIKASPDLAAPIQLGAWIRARLPRTPLVPFVEDDAAIPAEPHIVHEVLAPLEVVSASDTTLAEHGSLTDVEIATARIEIRPTSIHLPAQPPRYRRVIATIAALAAVAAAVLVVLIVLIRGPSRPVGHLASPRPLTPAPRARSAVPEPAPPLPARTPPVSRATVEVVTRPPAALIALGGVTLRSPAIFKDVSTGVVALAIELEGYETVRRDLTLIPDEHRTVHIGLVPLRTAKRAARTKASAGYLVATAPPGGTLYLGNRRLGETPLDRIELPAGNYRLTFKSIDHTSLVRWITIRPGRTTTVAVSIP